MNRFTALLLAISLTISCSGKKTLYQSNTFTIDTKSVTQGNFKATVLPDGSIRSNYISNYKKPTNRTLNFKFSLNGDDNERFPGEDHLLILRPENGKQVSPVYTFGAPDPISPKNDDNLNPFLKSDVDLTIQVDMNPVFKAFKKNGYFILFNGNKFFAKDFKGLYIAGNTLPLSWDFANLSGNEQFELHDPDNDGIYELTFTIRQFQQVEPGQRDRTWSQDKDISSYPQYQSEIPLSDALYRLSLEELMFDIRDDGAFMAGAKWPGVWTRDISYSILLSLAIIEPDVARKSLMHKVKNDRIIQDTGTGGSWPVSTDRMTWALAAWEIYKVTGERDWLETAYAIIKNSAEDDLKTAFDPETGLVYGESSFLDWREQSYPRWMDPKDIYKSQCLGTNAVHYQTYVILSQMADILEIPEQANTYKNVADKIKQAVNQSLWQSDAGYYGQYLYGRSSMAQSPRSETLGEALCILFDIADSEQRQSIISNTPTTPFGTTCFFPQIPNMPDYHNNGIWPFVETYWAWAAAKAGNSKAVEHSIASIYRPAALFLTNKENMVATTGDYMGTEINSDRQLWSIAGNLAVVYRIFFGMEFQNDGLCFQPFIPENYNGNRSLNKFRYRDTILDISVEGFGSGIAEITLDGQKLDKAFLPADITGQHNIHIRMNDQIEESSIILKSVDFAPETPIITSNGLTLTWSPVESANQYDIYKNGQMISSTKETKYSIKDFNDYAEYQVLAVDNNGYESFLSEPVPVWNRAKTISIKPEKQFQELSKQHNRKISFDFNIRRTGLYALDIHYSNGNGPINTNNKCAIRSAFIDEKYIGIIVLPQRGDQNWADWGYSNIIKVNLNSGNHSLIIEYLPFNENMNDTENSAQIDEIRLIPINQ